jgi:Ribonuclease G/E
MAWLEAGELQDYLVLRDDTGPHLGARYLGRINAVDKGLGAAFVELGLERSGILPLEDLPRGVTEGAALLVEVARAAQAGKGARLRTKGLTQPAGEIRDSGKIPRLIDAGPEELERALQRAGQEEIDEIVVDDLAVFKRVKAILATFDGAFRGQVTLHRAMPGTGSGLLAAHDLEARLESLLRPEVTLPSGARLRIEPTQTLVAVDVDSAESRQHGKAARRALAINREAAEALAQELRLRALSGLIVVDFLALPEASARKELERSLRQALEKDPAKTRVFPMRPFGLLDMTRQRMRRPLHEVVGEPCGSLALGWRLSAETSAFAALRRLRTLTATEKARAWCLRAPAAVLAAFEGPARRAREAVESELGRPLDLAAREAYDRAGNYLWEIVPA